MKTYGNFLKLVWLFFEKILGRKSFRPKIFPAEKYLAETGPMLNSRDTKLVRFQARIYHAIRGARWLTGEPLKRMEQKLQIMTSKPILKFIITVKNYKK